MKINFSELSASFSASKTLSPREIFMSMPQKNAKYEYPRDVQFSLKFGISGSKKEMTKIV